MLVRTKAARGFTLIELLVALLITATVVLGFSSATLAVMRANRLSAHYSEATALAHRQMARLRGDVAAGNTLSNNSILEGEYKVAWTILPPTPGASSELQTVRVTVSWNDSVTHSYSFESVLPRK